MPKKKNDNGTKAAIGMLRPNKISGIKNALIGGKHPASTPSGTPTAVARAKPDATRYSVVNVLRVSSRSNQSCSKDANVSAGLGKAWGLTIRCSTISPRVTNHHNPSTITTHNTPSITELTTPISPRMGNHFWVWGSAMDLIRIVVNETETCVKNQLRNSAPNRALRRHPIVPSDGTQSCPQTTCLLNTSNPKLMNPGTHDALLQKTASKTIKSVDSFGRINFHLHPAVFGLVERVVLVGRTVPA